MPNEIRTVAFIGLGKMGSPMAANIAKAGFALSAPEPPAALAMRRTARMWW
jgi:3-hydroxyisobutyrate dehydrogenase-like beta-hydroxyacid dehydrogenase